MKNHFVDITKKVASVLFLAFCLYQALFSHTGYCYP